MDDDPLPFIAEKDYGAFLRIIKRDFPDAYDEWPDTHDGWIELHEREKLKRRRQGHIPRDIDVRPDEFAEFCHRHNYKGGRQDFLRFAITIAKAEPQRVISDEEDTEDRED